MFPADFILYSQQKYNTFVLLPFFTSWSDFFCACKRSQVYSPLQRLWLNNDYHTGVSWTGHHKKSLKCAVWSWRKAFIRHWTIAVSHQQDGKSHEPPSSASDWLVLFVKILEKANQSVLICHTCQVDGIIIRETKDDIFYSSVVSCGALTGIHSWLDEQLVDQLNTASVFPLISTE